MALPSSGALSLSMVNIELKKSASAAISMNDAAVRTLFGKASGVISLSDGYGKANEIVFINTANRTGASIFGLMGSPTQPGTYIFENKATISAGTGSYALRTGVFPAGSILKIVNKGYIRGSGGAGGPYNGAGGPGGTALYIDMGCTIDNGSGYIFGGGGGGGGAGLYYDGSAYYAYCPAGGGAGSNGGSVVGVMSQGYAAGMAAAATPSSGSPDSGGTGGYYYWTGDSSLYAISGNGGNPGTAGVAGTATPAYAYSAAAYAGGSAGAAIARNGKTVPITAGNDTTRIKGAIT